MGPQGLNLLQKQIKCSAASRTDKNSVTTKEIQWVIVTRQMRLS